MVVRHGHKHFVEKKGRPLKDIQVAVGNGIERAGVKSANHGGKGRKAGWRVTDGK
jgi:hypothetical protein